MPDSVQNKIDPELTKADLMGKKLGILIASLPADDEIKEAFLALAEHASYADLIKLTDALEMLYLNSSARDIDEQFKKDLEALKSEMEKSEQKSDEEFLNRLKEIEEKITSQ